MTESGPGDRSDVTGATPSQPGVVAPVLNPGCPDQDQPGNCSTGGPVSEYDQRAEAWVRKKFGGNPDPGSVEFANDCAAYGFDGPVTASVSWKENGGYQSRELDVSAWQYDWTDIIRELLDIDLSTAGGTGRSA